MEDFFVPSGYLERSEAMFSQFSAPNEGDLYKELTVGGHDFQMRYGYYEECDRMQCQPVVIWPDLSDGQKRSEDGYPLVTQVQDPCEHYTPTAGSQDYWCGDCIYYTGQHREIGICRCEHRKG